MANRKATITQDHLYCPACKQDYSNSKLVERFDKVGNKSQLIFPCDCKRKLSLRLMVNGWFKIYDITDITIRKNQYDCQKRMMIKQKTYGRI